MRVALVPVARERQPDLGRPRAESERAVERLGSGQRLEQDAVRRSAELERVEDALQVPGQVVEVAVLPAAHRQDAEAEGD